MGARPVLSVRLRARSLGGPRASRVGQRLGGSSSPWAEGRAAGCFAGVVARGVRTVAVVSVWGSGLRAALPDGRVLLRKRLRNESLEVFAGEQRSQESHQFERICEVVVTDLLALLEVAPELPDPLLGEIDDPLVGALVLRPGLDLCVFRVVELEVTGVQIRGWRSSDRAVPRRAFRLRSSGTRTCRGAQCNTRGGRGRGRHCPAVRQFRPRPE